ncbi:hypothetical protein [Anaerolinea sp.]|uniref:hypothetical protein n=1 Tax=Anaerolinea sp. TaxID=1872519 RepID=UPI002ACECA10|nr:hypothetical protein [Anaerolinea sp.]
MSTIMKPLAEINQQAIQLLYQELGVVNAVRFLRQFTTGFGDYTRERESLFAGKSLQEIVHEIEQQKGQSLPHKP